MQINNKQIRLIIDLFFLTYVSLRIIISQSVVCPQNTYLFSSACFTSCNIFTVRDQSNNTIGQNISQLYYKFQGASICVQQCASQCQTCDTYSDQCTSCLQTNHSNFLLFSKCYEICPQFYVQNYTSLKCDSCADYNINCKDCSLNKQCVQFGGTYNCSYTQTKICLNCDINRILFYSDKTNFSTCVDNAPDGYANILGVATKCNSICLTCSQFVWNCTYCTNLIFYNSQCVDKCPLSHFNETLNITFNLQTVQTQICTLCVSPCLTCLNQLQCLSCLTGFYYSSQTFECVNGNECPITTYPNNTNYQCQKCQSPCRRCLNYNQCQQCLSGYLYQGGCYQNCPISAYKRQISDTLSQNNLTLVCNACVSPCKYCINQVSCTQCIDSTIIYYYSLNLSCLYNCPNQYYKSKNSMTCQKCPQNCQTCNETQCFTCIQINNTDVYYMQQGKCLNNCMNSYFPSFTSLLICQSCPTECILCQNFTFCTQCIDQYFLISTNFTSICESACSGPYFVQKTNSIGQLICVQCSDYLCQKCTIHDFCENCISSYNNSMGQVFTQIAILNGKCYLNCPLPYQKVNNFYNTSWICEIPSTISNNTQIQLIKGIVVSYFIQFLGCYASGGIFILVLLIFLIVKFNQKQKGLFFVMLAASLSISQTYVIIVLGYSHFMYHLYQFTQRFWYNALSIILFGCFLCYLIINIVNVYLFVKVSSSDSSYHEWRKHNSKLSLCFLIITNSFSLINYKFHNILWSKFGFLPVFEQISKLSYYNTVCGIGIFPTLGILICSGFSYSKEEEIKNIYLDGIIVICIQTLILFVSLKRPKDLFIFYQKQIGDDMISFQKRQLHRKIIQEDQIIGGAIKPTGIQFDDQYLNKINSQNNDNQTLTSNRYKNNTQSQKSGLSFRESQRMLLQIQTKKKQKIKHSEDNNNQVIFCFNNSQNQDIHHKNSLNESIISFQSSDNLNSINQTKKLIIDDKNIIHKSSITKQQKEKRTMKFLSKSNLVQRIKMNESQLQIEKSITDQLNDAISSIDQGTERGQQGSFYESNFSIQQAELKNKQNYQKNYQNIQKFKQDIIHKQIENQIQNIQIVKISLNKAQQKKQSRNINFLEFLNFEGQTDQISDKAVFQESFQTINVQQNDQSLAKPIQQSVIKKNVLIQENQQNKSFFKEKISKNKQHNKQNQILKKQLQIQSQEQNNSQYFGGYSVDNSMGSIESKNFSSKQLLIQNEVVSDICQIDYSENTEYLNKNNSKKQQNKTKIIANSQTQIKDQLTKANVKKLEVQKQKLQNQFFTLQLQQTSKKEQKELAKMQYKNKEISSLQIEAKQQEDNFLQLKKKESNQVSLLNKSGNTVQISQDIIENKQLKQEIDIIPLVFNQKNQQFQEDSIIYKNQSLQNCNVQIESKQKSIAYIYNNFSLTQMNKKDKNQDQFQNEIQNQFQNQKNSNKKLQQGQELESKQQMLQHQVQNELLQTNNPDFIQFRIKTTLRSNKKKIENQKDFIKNQKRDQILIIEDKKFKKIKKQLKMLEKQQKKQKFIIHQMLESNFQQKDKFQNKQSKFEKRKSLQKHNKINQKKKSDIQKIYMNSQNFLDQKKDMAKK